MDFQCQLYSLQTSNKENLLSDIWSAVLIISTGTPGIFRSSFEEKKRTITRIQWNLVSCLPIDCQ